MMRDARTITRMGWTLLAAAVAVLAGCAKPAERLNAPPQGASAFQNEEVRKNLVYMQDNALLADASMSSVHFAPHTAELNGLGLRRLNRYADILRTYNGITLRYDGNESDQDLVSRRVNAIRDYLLSAGLEPGTFSVNADMAGGEGIYAEEAGRIRAFTAFSAEQQQREEKGAVWDKTEGLGGANSQ